MQDKKNYTKYYENIQSQLALLPQNPLTNKHMSQSIDSLASRSDIPTDKQSTRVENFLRTKESTFTLNPELRTKLDNMSQEGIDRIIKELEPIIDGVRQTLDGIDDVIWRAIRKLLEKWADKLIPPTRR